MPPDNDNPLAAAGCHRLRGCDQNHVFMHRHRTWELRPLPESVPGHCWLTCCVKGHTTWFAGWLQWLACWFLCLFPMVHSGYYDTRKKRKNNLSRDVGNAKKQCAYLPIQNFEEIHGGKGWVGCRDREKKDVKTQLFFCFMFKLFLMISTTNFQCS